VPLVARLEREVAGLGVDHLVAELCAQPALQHVAVFILAGVAVPRRGQVSRPDRVLDEREPAA
jgi:hypothetical protein